jgi:hypothetical protein
VTERARRSLEEAIAAQQRGGRVEQDPVEATQEELRHERQTQEADSDNDSDRESEQ